MQNAIFVSNAFTLLAAYLLAFGSIAVVLIASAAALGIAARHSEHLHIRLARLAGYQDHQIARKGS